MENSLEQLAEAIFSACEPSHLDRIMKGREAVATFEKDFVIKNLEEIANQRLDLSDHWQYRRLLELSKIYDSTITMKLTALGIDSENVEIREAAEDFSEG